MLTLIVLIIDIELYVIVSDSSKVRRKRHAPTSFTSASPHHLHYNLTPATIQQCRTGYTRLVSIKQFRESYNELQKTLEAEIAMTNDGPDLR